MGRIIGISGSLRAASYNSALLAAVAELSSGAVEIASIRGIPLYDGDLEKEQGTPELVQQLQSRIAAADGLLLVTPEYNNSMPGVFKNAIDWLSRPAKGSTPVFRGKPTALMGATVGGFGTILSQNAWLPVLRALAVRHWSGGRLMVAHAQNVFDPTGKLLDKDVRDRLEKFIEDFELFIDS